jgi:hypothetical protein
LLAEHRQKDSRQQKPVVAISKRRISTHFFLVCSVPPSVIRFSPEMDYINRIDLNV